MYFPRFAFKREFLLPQLPRAAAAQAAGHGADGAAQQRSRLRGCADALLAGLAAIT
jgi:hypothetical protein